MPGSPEAARAETRLEACRKGRIVLHRRTWPGTNLALQLRVLLGDEVQAALAAAYLHFRDVLKVPPDSLQTVQPFEDEVALQLLHRACRDPENAAATFAISDADLRDNTTVDERVLMVREYEAIAAVANPSPDSLSPEEFAAIVDAVKKKDRAGLLGHGVAALATYLLTGDSQPSS
jgi:hypothetical protein